MTSYLSTIKESNHATNQQNLQFPIQGNYPKIESSSIRPPTQYTVDTHMHNGNVPHTISLIRKHATPTNTCNDYPQFIKISNKPTSSSPYYAVCTFERYLVLVSTRQSFDHCCKMSIKMRMSIERMG